MWQYRANLGRFWMYLTLGGPPMLRSALLCIFLLASSSPSLRAQDSTQAVPGSPCDDPRYLQLKKRPLDSLSEEEFQYLKDTSKRCDEALKLRALAAPVQATPSGPSHSPRSVTGMTMPGTPAARGRGLYFAVTFGPGWTAQSDLNGVIKAQKQILTSAGISVDWKTFGIGPELSGEVGYRLTPKLAIAVGGAHQSQAVDNQVSDYTGSLQDSYTASINEVVGTIVLSPFDSPDVSIGGNAGIGFGTLKEEFAFRDFANASNDFTASGDWSGSGFVGALFVGLSHALGDAVEVQARAGYKYRNLGTFNGTVTSQYGTVTGGPKGASGDLLEIDYSGLFAQAGFSFRFDHK